MSGLNFKLTQFFFFSIWFIQCLVYSKFVYSEVFLLQCLVYSEFFLQSLAYLEFVSRLWFIQSWVFSDIGLFRTCFFRVLFFIVWFIQ